MLQQLLWADFVLHPIVHSEDLAHSDADARGGGGGFTSPRSCCPKLKKSYGPSRGKIIRSRYMVFVC